MNDDINEVSIVECLDIIRSEYEIERNKKQSFDNRAGLLITIIAAVCIFVLKDISLKDIGILMKAPLTFPLLVKILAGINLYLSFIITVIAVLFVICTRQYDNMEVASFNEKLYFQPKRECLTRLIIAYRDIIVQHRKINKRVAIALKIAIVGVVTIFISIAFYINF